MNRDNLSHDAPAPPTLEDAYAQGRADEREEMRTLLQQTRCVRDGWHAFTALTMQAELLAALDDADEQQAGANAP